MSATALPIEHRTDPDPSTPVTFMWLEITGKCQLECGHCYADSGPQGDHGTMTAEDWRRVIDDAAAAGVRMVQFIGGEPTLHPHLPELIDHALAAGLEVEVYSNLVHVNTPLWQRFTRHGVRLATSFYSAGREEHAQIVGRDTLRQTQANIERAVQLGVPIRIGRVDVLDGQDNDGAAAWLQALGLEVDPYVDHVRGVGRGTATEPNLDALCGNCATNVLAIGPTGLVWPCVFSRFLPIGNVKATSLPAVLAGRQLTKVRDRLNRAFAERYTAHACAPGTCLPTTPCGPKCRPSACEPARHHEDQREGLNSHPAARRGDPCYPNCAPSCQPMAQCMPRNPGSELEPAQACEPICAPYCGPHCQPSQKCFPDIGMDAGVPLEAGCSPACWPTTGCSPMCSPSCNPSHHAEPAQAACVPDRCAPDLNCTPSTWCNPMVRNADCHPTLCGPADACYPKPSAVGEAACQPTNCNPQNNCNPGKADELTDTRPCRPTCNPKCYPNSACVPHPVEAELVPAGGHSCNPDWCAPNCAPYCNPTAGCKPR